MEHREWARQLATGLMGLSVNKRMVPCPDGKVGCTVADFAEMLPNGETLVHWDPFTNLGTAFQLEEKLRELNRHAEYTHVLQKLITFDFVPVSIYDKFDMVHADAELRSYAVCRG